MANVTLWDDGEQITDQEEANSDYGGVLVNSTIEGPFFHGSNNANLAKSGLREDSYISDDVRHAAYYGKYIYQVNLPSNFPIEYGEGPEEFNVLKRVPSKYVIKISDEGGLR